MAEKNKKYQLFWVCFLTYVVAYVSRINLSAGLLKIAYGIGTGTGQMGIMGSCFFFTYAAGQLINGIAGEYISPYRYIKAAAAGCGILNFIIFFTCSFPVMVICWSLNGFFQSMFWGPMMKLLSANYQREDYDKIATGMGLSIIIGYIMAWVVLARLLKASSWQYFFLIHSLFMMGMFIIWKFMPINQGIVQLVKKVDGKSLKGTLVEVRKEKLYTLCFLCFFLGMVRESVTLWMPAFIENMPGVNTKASLFSMIMIPIFNLIGVIAAKKMLPWFRGNIKKVIALFTSLGMSACCICCITIRTLPVLAIFMIAVISAAMFGCNTIIISFFPLYYQKKESITTLVGIFDFSTYAGAGVSSIIVGFALSYLDQGYIPVVWLAALVSGVCICLKSGFYKTENM